MLRNFIVDLDNSAQENTIILNKYLITKAIDTSNLTVQNKIYKDPTKTLVEEYNC